MSQAFTFPGGDLHVNYWVRASANCAANYRVTVAGQTNNYSLGASQGWTNVDFIVPSVAAGSQTISFVATWYGCSGAGSAFDDISVTVR
jgi:hypothetical protein